MTEKREILVTNALPYANGPIHLGHLLEYIQADIWVRFQRLRGNDCHYICADDAHGTPIMIKAQEEGVAPEQLIARMHKEHLEDFKAFLVRFDNYHTTHSDENRELSNLVYRRLRDGGHIVRRSITQAFDEQAGMFLPDRYIRGECPRCGAAEQYGDCCEVCGSTYAASELVNPVSVLSRNKPVERESEHYFFRLGDFAEQLKAWTQGRHVQPEISNKLSEWFEAGLQDWDISRDAPYFGFEIPDHPGKYFYVWLDAPIGYMASFRNYCERGGADFNRFWQEGGDTELHHFIGKDIAYFHTLFWPAMLAGAGFRQPTAVHCHGFVTINGQKMSKSRGTFITAKTYLRHLPPEYLRYYFATKLGNHIGDADLNLDDFVQRVNSDLVGKIVNIASRCASFIHKHFDDLVLCTDDTAGHELYREFTGAGGGIARDYENLEYAAAMRSIMVLADKANQYIDRRKPWDIAKRDGASAELHIVCSLGLLLFSRLALYLRPVLPDTCAKAAAFLNCALDCWQDDPFADKQRRGEQHHKINRFQPLLTRIERTAVRQLVAAPGQADGKAKGKADSKTSDKTSGEAGGKTSGKTATSGATAKATQKTGGKTGATDAAKKTTQIEYADFQKLDLRVGKIINAETVDGADKLLRLEVDIGEANPRSILAGIRQAYKPEQLRGRLVVVVANLAPKKMRFGVSEGMVLAAGPGGGPGGGNLFLVAADDGAEAGMEVK